MMSEFGRDPNADMMDGTRGLFRPPLRVTPFHPLPSLRAKMSGRKSQPTTGMQQEGGMPMGTMVGFQSAG